MSVSLSVSVCLSVSIILKELLLPEARSCQINSVPGVQYLSQNVGQGCPEDPEDNTGNCHCSDPENEIVLLESLDKDF